MRFAMIRAHISIEMTGKAREACFVPRMSRFLSRVLFAVALVAVPTLASAEIGWHRDYQAARKASAASGKPVFALFVASWDEEPSAEVFANAEVEAVIAACFEPVRVDVDKEADLIRELAIERIPSVAVINARSESVSRFECPKTPAEFVAAAARAAQVSAADASPHPDTAPTQSVAVFGGSLGTEPGHDDSSVADKVRQLSNFAEGKSSPVRDQSRFPVVHQQAEIPTQQAYAQSSSGYSQQPYPQSAYSQPGYPQAPPAEAALPRTPPTTWQPEQPAASAYAQFQPSAPATPADRYAALSPSAAAQPSAQAPGGTASIEPAPSTNANPWLAGTPAQPTDAEPEASATASDEGIAKKPASSGFMAGVQKAVNPFSWWSAKPAVEPPPKMPPARSQPSGVFAAQPAVVPPATASMTPVADSYGSMPLGLEGFCPVTIAERGAWVEGRAQWGVRHRGRTYLFAGPEQQQSFMSNPDRYAPALSGDDPVLAFEAGRSEPGQRALGVTYGSRMYLFSSAETRAAFSADPTRYTTRVQMAEGLAPADSTRRF
jgi:YHS domain-containing protein